MPPHRQHWAGASAVAIVILAAQYSLLVMSQQIVNKKAHWNETEVYHLVQYYYDNRHDIAEGNFKTKVYNAAANYIAPYLSHGPKKTAKMCKTKWISVCYHH